MKIKRPRNTGSIYQRNELWWIKFYRNGKAYRESSNSKERGVAEKLLRSRLGEVADDRFKGIGERKLTVGDLLDLVAEDYRITGKRSVADLQWRTDKHLRPRFGKVKAIQFGTLQVKRYISDRRLDGASDATINRELAILQRGFSLATQCDPPLITRAPHITKLAVDNARFGFIENAQYLKLREALPDHLKCLLVVGYNVGMRLGELRKLEWSQVDLKAQEIRIKTAQAKGKRPRTIPIIGEMNEWLEMQRAQHVEKYASCPLVFHWHGRPIGAHLKGWRAACKSAGLPALLFHDLRRSAVRNLERAGVPRRVAMQITGHKTESVYRRYDIVSTQDLRNAAAKLEAFQAGLGTKSPNSGTGENSEKTVN